MGGGKWAPGLPRSMFELMLKRPLEVERWMEASPPMRQTAMNSPRVAWRLSMVVLVCIFRDSRRRVSAHGPKEPGHLHGPG